MEEMIVRGIAICCYCDASTYQHRASHRLPSILFLVHAGFRDQINKQTCQMGSYIFKITSGIRLILSAVFCTSNGRSDEVFMIVLPHPSPQWLNQRYGGVLTSSSSLAKHSFPKDLYVVVSISIFSEDGSGMEISVDIADSLNSHWIADGMSR